jgi:hypothetical protein
MMVLLNKKKKISSRINRYFFSCFYYFNKLHTSTCFNLFLNLVPLIGACDSLFGLKRKRHIISNRQQSYLIYMCKSCRKENMVKIIWKIFFFYWTWIEEYYIIIDQNQYIYLYWSKKLMFLSVDKTSDDLVIFSKHTNIIFPVSFINRHFVSLIIFNRNIIFSFIIVNI